MIPAPFTRRGFLPEEDPLRAFPRDSGLSVLDESGPRPAQPAPGQVVPRLGARAPASRRCPRGRSRCPILRLYYVRLGFLASAYVNQVGQEPATVLPRNIALPLCDVCARLGRPPILSYDGYALYNWKRFDPAGPIALGNIDTIQNFVHLYDEHWFILVHVEIEALAASLLAAIDRAAEAMAAGDRAAAGRRDGRRRPGALGPGRDPAAHPREDGPGASTTRRSGRTSASSRASSTREWTRRPWTSAARPGPRAA